MTLRYGVPKERQYDWTDEAVEFLKAEWKNGLSASQIVLALPLDRGGMKPSRSAVLGKINRLGLSGRGRATGANDGGQTMKVRAAVRRAPRVASIPGTPPPEKIVVPTEAPVPLRLHIEQLDNDSCRFPYGHPGTEAFYFCGVPQADNAAGEPYCPFHRSQCWVRPDRHRSAPSVAPTPESQFIA